jgi:hypothetical protein
MLDLLSILLCVFSEANLFTRAIKPAIGIGDEKFKLAIESEVLWDGRRDREQ